MPRNESEIDEVVAGFSYALLKEEETDGEVDSKGKVR